MLMCELPSSSQCSFAGVFGQIFLRLKLVASWLRLHSNGNCAGIEGGCVSCALQKTRESLVTKMPRTLLDVLAANSDANASSMGVFGRSVVEDMVSAEPRGVPWVGIDSPPFCRATQVDGLFAFVEERRLRCRTCSCMSQDFRRDVVMELPAPEGSVDVASLTDLYLQRCASREVLSLIHI